MENRLNITYLVVAIFSIIAVVRLPVGQEMRPLFVFMVRVGVVFLFSIYLMEKVNLWVGLFLILALFSHSMPWFSLTNGAHIQTQESYVALNSVAMGCLLYFILTKSDLNYNIILNMMCVLALINIVFVALQRLNIDPYPLIGIKGNCSPTGLMSNQNELSAFLAICTPAFFRNKWFWFLPIVAVGLFLAGSLNGVLGASLATFVFLMFHEYKFIGFIALFIGVGVFLLNDDFIQNSQSISQRLYIWKKALYLSFKNQPFLGFGLGNWLNVNEVIAKAGDYKDGLMYTRVHNTFIQGFVEMGVGFIVVLIGYAFSLIKQINRKNILPLSALGAIIVCCSTNSLFRMNAINGMFVILWLTMFKGVENEETKKTGSCIRL